MTMEPGTARDSRSDQLLTFVLDGQDYGVDILRVQEIKGWDHVTRIPNTPSFIKGVINLRGTIVPILDLRERFGLEQVPYGPTTVVVLVRIESAERSRVVGLVVDAVSDVCDLGPDVSRPPPDFGEQIDAAFIKGIATFDGRMVVILEVDRLLNGNTYAQTDGFAAA